MKNNIIVVFSSHFSEEENQKFIDHIGSTIGVKHTVVCYPNFNQYSLTQVYNIAIFEHNNEDAIMVFCHNDITIKTQNWGKLLLTKFNNSNYQILGVAGTTFLSETGRWWDDRKKMVGIVEHTNGMRNWVSEYSEPKRGQITPVVLVDGLFIAVDINDLNIGWDEEFKGFHMYDVSFCVPNYLDGCNIGVTTDIRILHNSVGEVNQEWENNRIQFAEKYKDELPLTIPPPFKNIRAKLTSEPKVTVVIPTKNNFKLLRNNIWSWEDVVEYENYEIIIADTGSDADVIKQYNEILDNKVRLVQYDYYNFAKINNDVVRNHVSEDTELLLFCNDDILLLNDALSRCVEIYNADNNIGTIGIRLHYGDNSIQHNGISIVRDITNNIHLTHIDLRKTKAYSERVNYNSLGNTAAFLLINKELFIDIGYFNENYIECFEDVELNLECLIREKKNISVCDAVAYHYESVSRDKSQDKLEKLNRDYFERLHPFYLKNKEVLDKRIRLIN